MDYLGAAAKAKTKTEKALASAGLEQSIKLFYAQEGRYPKSLQELVSPDYLNAIPPPPTGMRYDYNPTNGTLKVVPR